MRVLVAGASGYIGRHVVHELVRRGADVVAFVRPSAIATAAPFAALQASGGGAELRRGDVTDPDSVARDGFRGERFDAVVSCLASRTGGIEDAWRVDHGANSNLLDAARAAGVRRFVLLSAICVQKPRLAFQHAKLAFENTLRAADLTWSIVRPTAFFKSLAGQVQRVQSGRPFMLIGPGDGPACRPIAEADLARYIANCLEDPALQNAVLPIGGPGEAITPRERGEMLFELCGRRPRFRRIPLTLFDTMIPVLSVAGKVSVRIRDKAEFARIGRYYATEPMLWLDPASGRYDAAATPSFGEQTLRDFYRRVLVQGMDGQELREQALF